MQTNNCNLSNGWAHRRLKERGHEGQGDFFKGSDTQAIPGRLRDLMVSVLDAQAGVPGREDSK